VPARRFKEALECLYERYNRREYVHPDPLEFLYAYHDVRDREVAGLVAASLAVGRVAQILRSVAAALERLGPHPAKRVAEAEDGDLGRMMVGFKHRFLTGENLAAMLDGAGGIIRRHGSLEACFAEAERREQGLGTGDQGTEKGKAIRSTATAPSPLPPLPRRGEGTTKSKAIRSTATAPSPPPPLPRRGEGKEEGGTILVGLAAFAAELAQGGACGRIVSHPSGKSACKKLNLYLRWMVRSDAVDPGGWQNVHPRQLIVPLDVHLHRIGRLLGLTDRKQADLAAAMEVTAALRAVAPDDPVKYDFVLTRLGIRTDTDRDGFLEQCRAACRRE